MQGPTEDTSWPPVELIKPDPAPPAEALVWAPPEPRATAIATAANCCQYCGCPLLSNFYFCLRCGTPYKPSETVIPPSLPVVLTDGSLIQKRAPQAMVLFWTYFSTLIVVAIASILLFGFDRPRDAMIFDSVILGIVTLVFAIRYWDSLKAQFARLGLFQPWGLACIGLLVPALAVGYGWSRMLEALGANSAGPSGMSTFELVLLICVAPAILEEIAFRGLLQHWLQVAVKPAKAIVIASALFAALHFNILSLPYLFAVGMLLGLARYKTGSLYPSMLIHFLHNLVIVVIFV